MKRRTDNEKKSNKKKAVIAGLVVGISTVVLAFGLYMNYSKKDVPVVETNNPSIESVTENENPDINDVIKDSTQMDVKIEGVDAETEQSYSGVSDEDVGDDTGTQETTPSQEESIVSSETTTPSQSETTTASSESTEVQEVYSADTPVPATDTFEETNEKLEEAGLPPQETNTDNMTPEEVQAHNQAVLDAFLSEGVSTELYEDGDNTSVGITIQ